MINIARQLPTADHTPLFLGAGSLCNGAPVGACPERREPMGRRVVRASGWQECILFFLKVYILRLRIISQATPEPTLPATEV